MGGEGGREGGREGDGRRKMEGGREAGNGEGRMCYIHVYDWSVILFPVFRALLHLSCD